MTTRLKGFTVTLEMDMREDDAEMVVNAIRMIKHVLSVDPIEANLDDTMAQIRVRGDLAKQLADVLRWPLGKPQT